MNMFRLYPNYIKHDRRQDSNPVSFERRFNQRDRRVIPRPALLRKVIKDIRRVKDIFDLYLF